MKKSVKTGVLYKLLLAPYSLWAVLFIIVPLIFVGYYAFTDVDFQFTFDNFVKFFATTTVNESGAITNTYLLIFWRSLKLALISTVICLLIGYPLAYIISKASEKAQKTMITLIMLPMWTNFLIRTYAWMTILQDKGIINNFLGLISNNQLFVHIINTEGAVIIGMVYDFLPYMILPIYSVMTKMDFKLIEAAQDLGCNGFKVLKRVILPLSLPGIISGITMVLVPSISTFYISQKLGGKMYLIGDTIEQQYTAGDFHFAAAISFILMVILLVSMNVTRRVTDKIAYGVTD